MIPRVAWTDYRGRRYIYNLFDLDQEWVNFPANYILARRTPCGWDALFIGETDSLKYGIGPSHPAWAFCRSRGATHILVHFNFSGRKARQAEEQALVIAYEPPGNRPQPTPGYVILPDLRASA